MNPIPVTENNSLWKQPIEVTTMYQLYPALADQREYHEKKVIVTQDHTRLFGVVNHKTPVIRHTDLMDMLQQALARFPAANDATIDLIALEGGAKIKVRVDFPQYEVRVDNDVSHLRAYLFNNYALQTSQFSLRTGGFRHECENSMIFGSAIGGAKAKELIENWSPDGFVARIERELSRASDVQHTWKIWQEHMIDQSTAFKLIDGKFSKAIVNSVLQKELFPRTLWDFYNDLTMEMTHGDHTEGKQWQGELMIANLFYNRTGKLRKIPELAQLAEALIENEKELAAKWLQIDEEEQEVEEAA